MGTLKLVFYYRHVGKFALNVLAGALETDPDTAALPMAFPSEEAALAKAIAAALAQFERVLVLWSFYSPQFEEAAATLQSMRQQFPERVLHIAGGVHATAEPLQTLLAGFDYVAMGEGEQIMVDTARACLTDGALHAVQGLGRLVEKRLSSQGRGKVVDINHYPAGSTRHKKFGPLEITRGCIYACKFCQTPHIHKAKFRHRSLEQIKQNLENMAAIGFRDYRFLSPSSFSYGSQDESVQLSELEALLTMARSVVGKSGRLYFGTFPSEVRPEHISAPALSIVKKYADNDNIIIGGQSGSLRLLQSSRRGHDVESIRRAVSVCVEAGFKPHVDMLFGLPDEQEEDRAATRALAQELAESGAKIHSHTFMPLPGTPFRNAPPGTVDAKTATALDRLSAQGRSYGPWRKHMQIAGELSRKKK